MEVDTPLKFQKSIRSSQNLNNNGRRSSIFKHKKQKDPRNVRLEKDRNLKILVRFLTEHNFPGDYSEANLKVPGTNFVKNIFLFITYKLSPIVQNFEKFDTNINRFLKLYGFPFNLAKSYLQAPGTPNAWPYILSAMIWLIEIYEFGLKIDQKIDKDLNHPLNIYKKKTARHYADYLGGSGMDIIKDNIKQSFKEEENKLKKEIEEFNSKIEDEKNELENMKKQPRLVDYKKRLDKAKSDIVKFQKLCDKTKDYIYKIQKQTDSIEEEFEKNQRNLLSVENQVDYVHHQVSKQIISKEDVTKILNQEKALRLELNLVQQHLKEKNLKIENLTNNEKQKRIEIDDFCEKLNNLMWQISVVPKESKFGSGIDYSVKIDFDKLDGEKANNMKSAISVITNIDLGKTLKPRLESVMRVIAERVELKKKENFRNKSYHDELIKKTKKIKHNNAQAEWELNEIKRANDKKEQELNDEKEQLKKIINDANIENSNEIDYVLEIEKTKNELKNIREIEKQQTKKCLIEKIKKRNEAMKMIKEFKIKFLKQAENFKQLKNWTDKINAEFPMLKNE